MTRNQNLSSFVSVCGLKYDEYDLPNKLEHRSINEIVKSSAVVMHGVEMYHFLKKKFLLYCH